MPLSEGVRWVDSLVERARSGDLAAFEALADRYLPEIYRIAVAMVGADDARDVTQETLVSAWRELPGLRDTARFDSWLRSIVMNRARNSLRSRRRRPTVSLVEGADVALVDEPIGVVQRRLEVRAALEALTPEQREIFTLHYLADLPLREVASVLRLREGTVKSRLHAGLAALRAREAQAV